MCWCYFSSSSIWDVLEHLYLTDSYGYGLSCSEKYKIEEPGLKHFPIVCSIYSVSEVLETHTSSMTAMARFRDIWKLFTLAPHSLSFPLSNYMFLSWFYPLFPLCCVIFKLFLVSAMVILACVLFPENVCLSL